MSDVVMKEIEKSDKDKPFEEVAVEYRDRIRKVVGKEDAQRYMEMANGILVFFPKDLRKTVVSTYGEIMAARGKGLADAYLEALKDLYRQERDTGDELRFTKKAVGEGKELLLKGAIPSWIPLRGTFLKMSGTKSVASYFDVLKKELSES